MSRRPSGYLACSARKRSSSAYAGANSPAQRGMLRLNLRQFTRNAVRCCSRRRAWSIQVLGLVVVAIAIR